MEDHALINISDGEKTVETIVALPDSARFSYISLTGEHCMISNIHIDREDFPIEKDAIPRIAEEVSYIRGCPQGDVPNVQVNRWRSSSTEGKNSPETCGSPSIAKACPRPGWYGTARS
jgi:hypothetical protein